MQSERDDLMKERAAHESATSDKYNAMKAQAEAEEIARTFEETVRSLRIQMRQEKAFAGCLNMKQKFPIPEISSWIQVE